MGEGRALGRCEIPRQEYDGLECLLESFSRNVERYVFATHLMLDCKRQRIPHLIISVYVSEHFLHLSQSQCDGASAPRHLKLYPLSCVAYPMHFAKVMICVSMIKSMLK